MDSGPRRLLPPAGSITIEHEEAGRRVLCLRGDVDTAVATAFKGLQGRDPVVVDAVDAGDVSFISSSGLAVMLLAAEASRAAGRQPLLRAASYPVDRALRLAGMDDFFLRPGSTPGGPGERGGRDGSPGDGDPPLGRSGGGGDGTGLRRGVVGGG
jgi:anti-anti-sigma factor